MSQTARRPWALDKNKAVLLVIDMQRDFVDEGAVLEVPMARQYVPNMKRIVEHCRASGIPVIHTKHVLYDGYDVSPLQVIYRPAIAQAIREGTRGVEIIDELAPQPGEQVIVKHRFDAFHDTRLETVIRNIRGQGGVDTVIIIGTLTSICCESTARSAYMRDFKVAFISDANGGHSEAAQQATLDVIGRSFGRVLSTEELINETN